MNDRQWHPGSLLEVSGSYWQGCTLHAGVKLKVFSVIGDAACSAAHVAEAVGANPRATGMLLNALTAMGLLIKTGDQYVNSDAARRYLHEKSDEYIGFMVMHHHHLVPQWARLDEAVISGKAMRKRPVSDDQDQRESFLMGMFNLAMQQAPSVARAIDLSTCRRLLDLGGGPGTYAIHFCLENPQLNASVYDLPTTRPFAEKTIARFDLADRIDFVAGDFTVDDVKGTYDAIWLSHILHAEDADTCSTILKKAVAALNAGGLLLIHDFILNDTMDKPLFPALFALNMLLGTRGGQAYSQAQLDSMMQEAGLGDIRRADFCGTNASGILSGRRIE